MKEILCTAIGIIGGALSFLFGGLDAALIVLLIFMAIDYITGVIVAAFFKNSDKSESGGLNSKAGWKGLVKKCVILLMVIVATMLDYVTGLTIVRDGVITAFVANELLSIIENAGLMGIPMPEVIKKGLDVLNGKTN